MQFRGYHTVARLAQHGAHVYLCSRSLAKGSAAITSITTLYPHAHISLLDIDHMDLSSVVAAAKQFLSKETVLHGLVNNAGIMATPFEITKDGYEAQWQTNYLAHWVLTSYLLPILLSTSKTLSPGSVRIVNLSSAGHWSAPKGGIVFEDTSLEAESPMTRYGQSKLGNVLHIKTLHKLYGPDSPSAKAGKGEIWCSAVHPGLVESNLGATSEFPKVMKVVIDLFATLGGRIEGDKGSWTSVFCAASPQMKSEQSGTYFQRVAEAGWQSSMAKDAALAARLEEHTIKEMKGKSLID
jgi:NAD(P)-dependent dehydrogenase (short-subunit alcohol dehydrogenase family)